LLLPNMKPYNSDNCEDDFDPLFFDNINIDIGSSSPSALVDHSSASRSSEDIPIQGPPQRKVAKIRRKNSKFKLELKRDGINSQGQGTDDIRRIFVPLFSEAINLGDFNLLHNTLQLHCTENVLLTLQCSEYCEVKSSLVVHGKHAVLAYMAGLQAAFPDGLVDLRSMKLKIMPTGDSMLICTLQLSGRKVLDLVGDTGFVVIKSVAEEVRHQLPGDGIQAFVVDKSTKEIVEEIPPSDRVVMRLTSLPTFFEGTSRWTLLIDANKQIYDINVLYSHVDRL
jgi:hypothetical protein